jgi:hypothetical protein
MYPVGKKNVGWPAEDVQLCALHTPPSGWGATGIEFELGHLH